MKKFEYINTYDLNVLKRAATFASTNQARIMFTGVLFNELGGVCGTDSFKVYAYDNIANLKYSVPVKFINLLNDDKCILKFNSDKVMYDGDYKIISSLYAGMSPDIAQMIINIRQENIHNVKIQKTDKFYFYISETIIFNLQNNLLQLTFKDNENEFKVDIPCDATENILTSFAYSNFITALNLFDELDLFYTHSPIKPVLVKNGIENINNAGGGEVIKCKLIYLVS